MGELVRLEISGAVGTIRLDRPKMNAIDEQLRADLRAAIDQVRSTPDVRAVVLYGGERVFAAGADIKEMSSMGYADMLAWGVDLQETFRTLDKLPVPVIAAIEGYALGGGCELALTADLRVAGASAKLGQPEILLGVIPGAGGTQRLSRLVGPARAKDLVFSGRMISADDALAMGLVDRVVPAGTAYDAAVELATRFAAGPAVALRLAKQAIDDGLEMDLDSGLRLESSLFAALFATEDQKTGMASFVENGPGKATFSGR